MSNGQLLSLENYAVGDEAEYPQLWEGCVFAVAPFLSHSPTMNTAPAMQDYSVFQHRLIGTTAQTGRTYVWSPQYQARFWSIDRPIDYGGAGNFERTDNFSVSMWWVPGSYLDNSTQITDLGKSDSTARGWELMRSSAAGSFLRPRLYLRNISSNALLVSTSSNVLTLGTPYHLCWTYAGTSSPSGVTCYLNGVQQSLVADSNSLTATILNSENFSINGRAYNALLGENRYAEVRLYNRVLNPDEVRLLAVSPNVCYLPRRKSLRSKSVVAWLLEPDGGQYVSSGLSVGLRDARLLLPGAGSVALSGIGSQLQRDSGVSPSAGTIAVGGHLVGLTPYRQLLPTSEAYTTTGQATSLRRSASLTPSSSESLLRASGSAQPETGVVVVAGQSVGLQHVPILPRSGPARRSRKQFHRPLPPWAPTTSAPSLTISPAAGSYVVGGTSLTLQHNSTLATAVGTYLATGQSLQIVYGTVVAPSTGSYLLSGTTTSLSHQSSLTVASGSITLTGNSLRLNAAWVLMPAAADYGVTGNSVTLEVGAAALPVGHYAVLGADSLLQTLRRLDVGVAVYGLQGQTVQLTHSLGVLLAQAGEYVLAGQQVGVRLLRQLRASVGDYLLVGSAVFGRLGYTLASSVGAYLLEGQGVALRLGRSLSLVVSAYLVGGVAVGLLLSKRAVTDYRPRRSEESEEPRRRRQEESEEPRRRRQE